MDSLLDIETKKQKVRQTDNDFNFHSVSLLSQAPLARGSSALSRRCLFCYYFRIPYLFASVCIKYMHACVSEASETLQSDGNGK